MDIKIIELPPERWQEYKDLRLTLLKLYPQSYGSSYEENVNNSDEEWQKRLSKDSKDKSLWLFAEVDGKLVGMVGALYYDNINEKHKVTIVGVGVLPEYQGKGIGRKLMVALLERIEADPTIRRIDLGVTSTQEPAFNMYKSLGFIKTGEFLKEFLIDGKFYDVWEMEKFINE